DHFTEALGARRGAVVYGAAAAGARRDGSVWRGALLGAALARAGARGETHGTAIRETLCEDEKKKPARCRSHRGSGDTSQHAVCAHQTCGATRPPSLAPRARTPYGCAHGSRQRHAWALGRVWYRVAHRGQRLSPRMGGEARSGTRQVDPSEPGTLRQAVGRMQEGGSRSGLL